MTWDWADTLTLLGGTALVGYNLGRLSLEVRWRRSEVQPTRRPYTSAPPVVATCPSCGKAIGGMHICGNTVVDNNPQVGFYIGDGKP